MTTVSYLTAFQQQEDQCASQSGACQYLCLLSKTLDLIVLRNMCFPKILSILASALSHVFQFPFYELPKYSFFCIIYIYSYTQVTFFSLTSLGLKSKRRYYMNLHNQCLNRGEQSACKVNLA
ncbi:hypothetical protein XENTR_v10008266 [Xenopus tropicalis]|nr:hypothetical protein XENTR_v10008266 [Xenopus tropicalis]